MGTQANLVDAAGEVARPSQRVSDSKVLDWLERDGGWLVFAVAGVWRTRNGGAPMSGSVPHGSLREAVAHAMALQRDDSKPRHYEPRRVDLTPSPRLPARSPESASGAAVEIDAPMAHVATPSRAPEPPRRVPPAAPSDGRAELARRQTAWDEYLGQVGMLPRRR